MFEIDYHSMYLALERDADNQSGRIASLEAECNQLHKRAEQLEAEGISLLETFVAIADFIGIDCVAAQSLPGKPSQVFIDAITKREEVIRAELEACRKDAEQLRTLLVEASETIEEWGAYADDYFKEKHGLARDVAYYRDAAMKEGGV